MGGTTAWRANSPTLSGRPLKALPVADLAAYNNLPAIDMKIEDPLCQRYSCLRVENINRHVSPMAMRIRLNYCGMRDINFLADLTNYLMLEMGYFLRASAHTRAHGTPGLWNSSPCSGYAPQTSLWKWDFQTLGKASIFDKLTFAASVPTTPSLLNQGGSLAQIPFELHFRNGGPRHFRDESHCYYNVQRPARHSSVLRAFDGCMKKSSRP